jgi:hypothetical protein
MARVKARELEVERLWVEQRRRRRVPAPVLTALTTIAVVDALVILTDLLV